MHGHCSWRFPKKALFTVQSANVSWNNYHYVFINLNWSVKNENIKLSAWHLLHYLCCNQSFCIIIRVPLIGQTELNNLNNLYEVKRRNCSPSKHCRIAQYPNLIFFSLTYQKLNRIVRHCYYQRLSFWAISKPTFKYNCCSSSQTKF